MQNTLFQQEEDEKERIANLCVDCNKNPILWDINKKDKCSNCLKKYYLNEFSKVGLDKKGYMDFGDNYIIYSQTTGKEIINKKRILAVGNNLFSNNLFDYIIQTCDEFGCFKNCFGVTNEFAEYLIKELNLEKQKDVSSVTIDDKHIEEENGNLKWTNPKIIEDKKSKKIFEFEEKVKKQKEEFDKELLKLKEIKQ